MSEARLILGDCLDALKTLESGSVDCVATSPPYNCGKQYGEFSDSLTSEKHWDFTRSWLAGCFDVLAEGGRLAVNLPWWMGKKPRLEVPFTFHRLALEVGFLFLDKVMWIKGDADNVHVSGGYGGGGCGWGTWMSPSGPAVRCGSEPILVFAKGSRGRGRVSGAGRGDCIKGDMTKEEFLAWTVDVWHVRPASHQEHPAVFPVEIPKRLTKLYTFPDETVLDLFAGTGTTGVACIQTGRNFIGIERDPAYFAIAEKRIAAARAEHPLFDKETACGS